MKPKSFTAEEFEQAVEATIQAGETLSAPNVRARLNKGSNSTINQMLRERAAAKAAPFPGKLPQPPEDAAKAVACAMETMWKSAVSIAMNKQQEAIVSLQESSAREIANADAMAAKLDQTEKQHESEMIEYRSVVERLQKEIQSLKEQLGTAVGEARILKQQNQQLHEQIHELQALLGTAVTHNDKSQVKSR